MSATAIVGALKAHVEASLPDVVGVWPNVPYPGDVPRYEFEMAAADRTGLLAPGEGVTERGRFTLTAVVGAGEAEAGALTLADTLAGIVPDGLWLAFTGGRLRIMGPATVRPGYLDGPEWRVPVLVRYEAFLS